MAKKITEFIQKEPAGLYEKEEPILESAAVSIVPRGNKKYDVVKVMFNSNTLESGKAEILHSNLDKYEAQYQFKILSVRLGMF